ncbi:uncharacterized protein LOC135370544 isoform X2 [Ornithodoros turicata]|uniref:uncharacterized protein LOC135370544 isoform X2 n=1 Tax=Ornithodoros turicata TaxID=34597 RepID=UPI00313A3FA0
MNSRRREDKRSMLLVVISEVNHTAFHSAFQCTIHVLQPKMLEDFNTRKASNDSGQSDADFAWNDWGNNCSQEDNGILRLLLPTQSEEMKIKAQLMVTACMNSTIYNMKD